MLYVFDKVFYFRVKSELVLYQQCFKHKLKSTHHPGCLHIEFTRISDIKQMLDRNVEMNYIFDF